MKNLLDVGEEIKKYITYFNNNDEHLNSVELNQNTLKFLKEKGIYNFYDSFIGNLQKKLKIIYLIIKLNLIVKKIINVMNMNLTII